MLVVGRLLIVCVLETIAIPALFFSFNFRMTTMTCVVLRIFVAKINDAARYAASLTYAHSSRYFSYVEQYCTATDGEAFREHV